MTITTTTVTLNVPSPVLLFRALFSAFEAEVREAKGYAADIQAAYREDENANVGDWEGMRDLHVKTYREAAMAAIQVVPAAVAEAMEAGLPKHADRMRHNACTMAGALYPHGGEEYTAALALIGE